ncbi:MAG TPA: glycerol-3-phosphate 1-O-acyltransferase PlsY [Steroidobacteraceae bacterium]|nr:glycerol-3-phosphate 1-O-acyltransferase PlsY [Steroidobacteraceae bacterium]
MLELGVKALLSYLLGSIVGSLLVGRLRGGVDIRKVGSGNAGGTNALRTQGKWFAFWVILIDVGKGVIAAAVVPEARLPGISPDLAVSREWLTVACAAAAILGHVYPVWHEFRGGKGAATLVGTLLGLNPALLLPVIAVWLLTVMITGYVGLATMCASAALPVYVCLTESPPPAPLVTFTVGVTLLVMFTHRGNVARMLRGNENRARRLWLLRR